VPFLKSENKLCGFVHFALDQTSDDLKNNAANACASDVANVNAATSSA
jgi:hypothetical protein